MMNNQKLLPLENKGVWSFCSRHLYSLGATGVVTSVYLTTGCITQAVLGFAAGIIFTDVICKIMKL